MPQLRHRVGDLIDDRYEVRKILGSGGFGTVYGCRDSELDISVAVKELHVLDDENSGNERAVALRQFRAEATHLSRLKHPNIVSGHYEPHNGHWAVCPFCGLDFMGQTHCPDHGGRLISVSARHYLVMEYIAGPDLLQLAESQGNIISSEQIEFYGSQIARALAHIHSRNLVHRDIKPENIRIRRVPNTEDEVVLLDFGIATAGEEVGEKYGTRAQRHTTGGGTVGYAPENPNEQRNPDARSDIHAFGMTMYHLATGLDPTDPSQIRKMRLYTPRDFVPALSEPLEELILKCIDFDPQKRPQNGAELLERLEELDAKVEVETPQPNVSATSFSPPAAAPLVYRSGHYVRDLAELRYMLDSDPRESSSLLDRGEIEKFLESLGERDLAREAASIRVNYRTRKAQGLELLAQKCGLERPNIEVGHREINFGAINPKGQKTVDIRLQNRGRGLLFGLVRASHSAVKTKGAFEGNQTRLSVIFDANRLPPGVYQGQLEIDSSAGQTAIPFRARVKGPSFLTPFITTAFCGIAGSLAGAFIRFAPFADAQVSTPFGEIRGSGLGFWQSMLFGGALWLIILAWGTIEAIVKRSCGLLALALLLGTGLGIFAAINAHDLIAGIDTALSFSGPSPIANWMLGGGALGAAYGALRRPKDLFSVRVISVFAGFIATGIYIYLTVQGAHRPY
jgi:serine/threonine protein kinase